MRLKLTWLEILVVAVTIVMLIAILLPNGDNDRSHRYPSTVIAGVPPATFAGDYHRNIARGGGWNLSILPDGRYSLVDSGCVGVLHREAGQAREMEGKVVLTAEIPNDQKVDREFLAIRWGKRSYLIRPDQIPRFCDEIVAGLEPRNGSWGAYYLDNPSFLVDGLPDVPEPWLADLKKRVAIGKVIEISSAYRARVGLGLKDGLKVNDRLRVQGEWSPRELKIIAVEEDSCLAEFLRPLENDHALKPGRNVVFSLPKISDPNP